MRFDGRKRASGDAGRRGSIDGAFGPFPATTLSTNTTFSSRLFLPRDRFARPHCSFRSLSTQTLSVGSQFPRILSTRFRRAMGRIIWSQRIFDNSDTASPFVVLLNGKALVVIASEESRPAESMQCHIQNDTAWGFHDWPRAPPLIIEIVLRTHAHNLPSFPVRQCNHTPLR